MAVKEWMKSAAYRQGYRDGKADGISEGERRARPIIIEMADGRLLHCENVVAELARAGWKLCRAITSPTTPPEGK